ncbi:MAG: DUF3179 domain-containing protein [Acidimicrobiia bacterium]|nr:DUF3179 domain-containing protein [Acidimicrobiia bacterium]
MDAKMAVNMQGDEPENQNTGTNHWLGKLAVLMVALVGTYIFVWSEVAGDTRPARLVGPVSDYDPVSAGEVLPVGYRPLLDRDQILPVYEPGFTDARGVDWPADMLVIGVANDSSSKAYPVTHLNRREMVIDWLDDEPILVSW